jgi:quercetin dioxygenase-like cupin family protein
MTVSKDTAPHYLWGGDCDGWAYLARPDLSVIRERMPPGRSEVRHHHERARQFFYVLTGALTLEIDGAVHVAAAGEGLEIAPGARHQARNETDGDIEFLVISHPTTRGDRIDER